MNPITIPYHLAIPSLICFLLLTFIFRRRKQFFGKNKRKLLWVSATVFLITYLLVVASATYADIFYQWDLNAYDLNQDGFFGENERTPQQKKAMSKLVNDTGRNFSFITGVIYGLMLAVPTYIFGKLGKAANSCR